MLNQNQSVNLLFVLISCVFLLLPASSSFADRRTRFTPTVSITDKYTDNYNQTENNKDDEFSTIYSAVFSFGVIDKNWNIFLNYNPAYTEYNDYYENDSGAHDIGIDGHVQITQHTGLTLSESFVSARSRSVRTNIWEQHDTNTTTIKLLHDFGLRDYISAGYTYSFDIYDDTNADEFKTHNRFMSLSYWFTPQFGFDLGASYEKTEYDVSIEDPETWSGDIKFLKSIIRHFDVYIAYKHTYTDQDSGDHTVYHPSIGFDWRPTDDTGISVGGGMLFHEWSERRDQDSNDFFADLDIYKNFNISRRGILSITASSGYNPTGDDAASLGFHIYYEAGFLFSYELARRLTGELNGTYTFDQYDESAVDERNDKTLGLGADLVWAPLQWLSMTLSYEFTDYDTDADIRDDYQENVGMITITMTPSQEIRFGSSTPRSDLENRLFN